MLINLLPDFFAVLQSVDPVAAYHRYFEAHDFDRIRGADRAAGAGRDPFCRCGGQDHHRP
jgi:hypothetical protein